MLPVWTSFFRCIESLALDFRHLLRERWVFFSWDKDFTTTERKSFVHASCWFPNFHCFSHRLAQTSLQSYRELFWGADFFWKIISFFPQYQLSAASLLWSNVLHRHTGSWSRREQAAWEPASSRQHCWLHLPKELLGLQSVRDRYLQKAAQCTFIASLEASIKLSKLEGKNPCLCARKACPRKRKVEKPTLNKEVFEAMRPVSLAVCATGWSFDDTAMGLLKNIRQVFFADTRRNRPQQGKISCTSLFWY